MKNKWLEKLIGNQLRQAEESVDTDQIWRELEPHLPDKRRPVLPIMFLVLFLGVTGFIGWWNWNESQEILIAKTTESAATEQREEFNAAPIVKKEMEALEQMEEKRLIAYNLDEPETDVKSPVSESREMFAQNAKPKTASGSESFIENLPRASSTVLTNAVNPSKDALRWKSLETDRPKYKSIDFIPLNKAKVVNAEKNSPAEASMPSPFSAKGQPIHFVEIRAGSGASSLAVTSNILPKDDEVSWKNRHIQTYSVLFGRRLNSLVEFSTGLQLTRWNQRLHYTSVREVDRPQDNQLVATILLINGTVNEQFGTLREQEAVRTTYQSMQELRAFELPLNVHMDLFERGRWSISSLLTGIFSWRQEIRGYFYPRTAWSDEEPALINRELTASGSFFQIAAGLGLGYQLNSHYSLYCYPQWRSGHMDIAMEDDIEFTMDGGAMALQVGLRRNF